MVGNRSHGAGRLIRLFPIILACVLLAGCTSGSGDSGVPTYGISGRVFREIDNAGVSGVTLKFSGGFGTATTGNGGFWSKSGLKGSVTVTPGGQGWEFTPRSRTVAGAAGDVNFAGTYRVEGLVSDADGTAVGSVRLDFSGGHASVHTGSDGRWAKDGLSGVVTVTPKAAGYTFTPEHATVNSPASGVNFTAISASSEYSVSGRVTDYRDVGIADVLLFLGGGFGTARTGSDGRWSATGLSGDVTVTPAKTGLVFTPETVTVSGSSSSVDFTGNAAASTYSVSGQVTDSSDGLGLYGVSFTFSGGFGRAQTDVWGNWSKSGLYGAVTVTPSRPGWTFQPSSRDVAGADSAVEFVGSRAGSASPEGGGK